MITENFIKHFFLFSASMTGTIQTNSIFPNSFTTFLSLPYDLTQLNSNQTTQINSNQTTQMNSLVNRYNNIKDEIDKDKWLAFTGVLILGIFILFNLFTTLFIYLNKETLLASQSKFSNLNKPYSDVEMSVKFENKEKKEDSENLQEINELKIEIATNSTANNQLDVHKTNLKETATTTNLTENNQLDVHKTKYKRIFYLHLLKLTIVICAFILLCCELSGLFSAFTDDSYSLDDLNRDKKIGLTGVILLCIGVLFQIGLIIYILGLSDLRIKMKNLFDDKFKKYHITHNIIIIIKIILLILLIAALIILFYQVIQVYHQADKSDDLMSDIKLFLTGLI